MGRPCAGCGVNSSFHAAFAKRGRASPVARGQGSRLIRRPDPFQTRVTRLALIAAREHGFALGGGHALIAYGIVSRPTEDVDLFTDSDDGVQAAAELVKAALIEAGMAIEVIPETSELGDLFYGFERDMVEFEVRRGEDAVRLQLVPFNRSRSPLTMEIGPERRVPSSVSSRAQARGFHISVTPGPLRLHLRHERVVKIAVIMTSPS